MKAFFLNSMTYLWYVQLFQKNTLGKKKTLENTIKRKKEKFRDNIIKKVGGLREKKMKRSTFGTSSHSFSLKGAIPIDYVLAAGVYLFAFAFVVQYAITYFDNVREISDILAVRSEATELLGIVDRGFTPDDWPELPNNDTSLVLLLHLNNDTRDYSRNGNNGTATGANCSSAVEGKFFSACSLDGVDDFINISNSQSINITTNSITIELWINTRDATKNNQRILTKGNNDNDIQWNLRFDGTTGKVLLGLKNSTRVTNLSSNSTILSNVSYHVAATYDGANMIIYINGIFDASVAQTGAIVGNQLPVLIGSHSGASPEYLNGTVDEIAIYNRSLSAAEIEEHSHRSSSLKRIGLQGTAYRFIVVVNNSRSFYANSSENLRDLNNESVLLNFSSINANADINSVTIYNYTNAIVEHYVHGMNVSFTTNITSSSVQIFTVYFSEGSVFPPRSRALIAGNNNTMNETIFYLEKLPLLSYNKLVHLNQSNYTRVVNSSDIENDFNILLQDADTNTTLIQFGKDVPKRGNVVALRRFALFQNGTAAIRNGRLTIRVW